MDTKQYISSEMLELYVYGVLSENENTKVYNTLKEHPEIKDEIKEIEKSFTRSSTMMRPYNPESIFNRIKEKLELPDTETVVVSTNRKHTNWNISLTQVVSLVLLIILLFSLLMINNS